MQQIKKKKEQNLRHAATTITESQCCLSEVNCMDQFQVNMKAHQNVQEM